jgi:nucleotide-binding universal stress UspA family protein
MGKSPPRILVAIHHAEELPDLVSLACSLAGADRHSEVFVLHVVLIPRTLPLETEMKEAVTSGESLLAKAEEVAEERFGLRVRTDLLQARDAGPAILEEIHEKAIDVVVLGHRRHRGFGEPAFSSTIAYVVRHAPCRVVIGVPSVHGGDGRREGGA